MGKKYIWAEAQPHDPKMEVGQTLINWQDYSFRIIVSEHLPCRLINKVC
jgi:hypothetical protein